MFATGLKTGIRGTYSYDLLWPIEHKRPHEVCIGHGRPRRPAENVNPHTMEEYANRCGQKGYSGEDQIRDFVAKKFSGSAF